MNILIITGIFPPDIGGPATYVPRIAEGLIAQGHQVTVLTLSDRKNHDDSGYRFVVTRLSRQTLKPWRWLWTVITIIRLGRYAEVLFVNGLGMEAALANLLLRRPLILKVVGDFAWERATNKGWVSDEFETFQTTRYHKRITRHGLRTELLKCLRSWWTRRADRIITPSRYLARWVAAWGVPAEKITVIYNALEPVDGIKPAPLPFDRLLSTTSLKFKVVTVGRLVRWKGVDGLLKAVAQLDGVSLVIVGDGPERQDLEEQTRSLGIAEKVYFAGQASHNEALSLIAACDLFVLNSSYEGFPHVVLEAMSLGLPVVATAVGGTPEVVEEGYNGKLIELSDNGLLQEALSHLITSPLERQHLAEGARRTAGHFRFSAMIEQTEAVLQLKSIPASA